MATHNMPRSRRKREAELKARPSAMKPIPMNVYPLSAARPKNSRLDMNKLINAFHLYLPH